MGRNSRLPSCIPDHDFTGTLFIGLFYQVVRGEIKFFFKKLLFFITISKGASNTQGYAGTVARS